MCVCVMKERKNYDNFNAGRELILNFKFLSISKQEPVTPLQLSDGDEAQKTSFISSSVVACFN